MGKIFAAPAKYSSLSGYIYFANPAKYLANAQFASPANFFFSV
jgi:hypothetical protein